MRSSVHAGSAQRSVIHQPQRLPSCQASKVESVVSLPFSFSWLFRELSGVLSSCQRLLSLFSAARLRPPSSPDPLPARRSGPVMIWTEPVSYAADDDRFGPRIVAVIARLCCHG